ncbi:MAG: hypothetical protein AAF211_24895, partial [Myxococcota bacterium]
RFVDRGAELRALADRVHTWVADEGVLPGDIRVLANSPEVREAAATVLTDRLGPLGATVESQARTTLSTGPHTLVVTTAHSFKGHEAEIVAVPGADRFVVRSEDPPRILGRALYVALTRARSVLYVSGSASSGPAASASEAVLGALEAAAEGLVGSVRA